MTHPYREELAGRLTLQQRIDVDRLLDDDWREVLAAVARGEIEDGVMPGESDHRLVSVAVADTLDAAAAALRQSPSVEEAVHEERQKSQAIINDRDKWIVELIRERDAALDLIRRAVKEAIPDAMIFAAHPEAARYKKALDGLRAWSTEAQAVDRLYRGSKE